MQTEKTERPSEGPEKTRPSLRYILFPFLLFLSGYLFDKLFFIDGLPDYFLRTAAFVNYEHKEELLEELETYLAAPDRRRTLVLFGNSRSMLFDRNYIEKTQPEWTLFNFSVPGGISDYFHRMMEEFDDRDLRPDQIVFVVTPQGFNATAKITSDESMLLGLTPLFVLKNAGYYSIDELSNYTAKKLFWTNQYRPKWDTILRRIKNPEELEGFRNLVSQSRIMLQKERGSVPYRLEKEPTQNKEFLKKTAEDTWNNFLNPFTISEGQMHFLERCLEITQRRKIPTTLLWARVGSELRSLKDEKPAAADGRSVRAIWEPVVRKLAERYDARIIDMNYEKSIECDEFQDASHMSGICFDEFTDFLFWKISGEKDESPQQPARDG